MRRSSRHAALTLASIVLLVGAPSCTLADEPDGSADDAFRRQMLVPEEPALAPDYMFREANGREWGFAEMRGRLIIATFWATWCRVCAQELPKLDRLQADLRAEGVLVVALAQDVGADEAGRYLTDRGLANLRGFEDVDKVLAATLGVRGVPTSFVIDPTGHVVGMIQGPAAWSSPGARSLLLELAH